MAVVDRQSSRFALCSQLGIIPGLISRQWWIETVAGSLFAHSMVLLQALGLAADHQLH